MQDIPRAENDTAMPMSQQAVGAPAIQEYAALSSSTPPHTHTESTLAPTSEFMRYVLAALPSRYVLRGLFGLAFNEQKERGTGFGKWVLDTFGKIGDTLAEKGWNKKRAEAAGYNATVGLGSLGLTLMYSATVKKDIKNIFSEAVAAEFDKPVSDVTFEDISRSQNRMIQKTLDNYRQRLTRRLAVDALFLPAAFIKHTSAGDFVIGLKGAQLFAETWKRKTTMFEDLVSFVNVKINPRNGLGQPIAVGEVFDLYQHYEQEFHPELAFNNVLERGGTGEGAVWAQSEPIFQRITQLMNQTYAYKHPSVLDPVTGNAIPQANFALPTLIYLLGHDLIDIRHPQRTRITIEVANKHGIPAVKEMQMLVAKGMDDATLMKRYAVTLPEMSRVQTPVASKSNAIIPKGSTEQLDAAPALSAAAPIPLTRIHAPGNALTQTMHEPSLAAQMS